MSELAREHIDDLALAFVAPLRPYENDIGHIWDEENGGGKNRMRENGWQDQS